jgi:hypothetical protein
MAIFGNSKHKQKNFRMCIWQHYGTQSSLWIQFNLDPMVGWLGLNKINVHTIYN